MEREEAFEFLGINKFRELGYTGSRVKIMSDERIIKDYRKVDKDRWAKVICPKGYQTDNGEWHGSAIMNILIDICPDATYIAFPMDMKGTEKEYRSKCVEYILENKVHLFTTSCIGGNISKTKEKAMQDCIDAGTTFFACAGNKDYDGMLGEAKSDKYISIGALQPNTSLKWANYSSIGKELDYVSIGFYGIGTSYTTPTFCAMCGLVQDFFIDKTGRALVRSELINFINDHLIDVEDEGFDIKTGNGLFILPNPSEIDIAKYVPEYKAGEDKMLKQKLIDESKYSIKCPYEMEAEFIVVHNTANDAPAINEVNYMANNEKKTSFHIAVDDKEAIQAIPFNRNAFHAGDGTNGKGNRKGIGIEICYSKSGGEKFEKAKENAIEVIVDILKERNWDITKVRKHQDFSGKYCPHRILDEGWDKFIAQIQERIGGANMKELVLTIGKKEYSVDNQIKRIEVAPRIENGRTLVPIAVLRDLGLDVEWNAEKRTVTVRG
jgi:hypothetical protein